jgi:hypothetical protein
LPIPVAAQVLFVARLPNARVDVAEKCQRRSHYTVPFVSKRTVKRKLRKKKKANHGKKPNCGR